IRRLVAGRRRPAPRRQAAARQSAFASLWQRLWARRGTARRNRRGRLPTWFAAHPAPAWRRSAHRPSGWARRAPRVERRARCLARATGRARPLRPGLILHAFEPLVVVGEFLHMCERDLPGDDGIVSRDVCLRIVAAVL